MVDKPTDMLLSCVTMCDKKTSIRASPHLQVMQLNTKCLLLKINPSLDLFYSVTLLVLLYLLEWQAHMQCQIPTFPIGSDG